MVYPMVRGDDQPKMRVLERDAAKPELTEAGHVRGPSSGRGMGGRGCGVWSHGGRVPVRRDRGEGGAVYRAGNVEGRGGR
jgi:hypothetical protein